MSVGNQNPAGHGLVCVEKLSDFVPFSLLRFFWASKRNEEKVTELGILDLELSV
ncbi:hypothetical protein [Solitalea koreensis]|uniref:hypothetical protein n=1 Tax=Solitalea koreensis TaxID=543615 RepID=UPI00163DD82D|nr:hypothetical protein [Solitalea koreensis]